MLWKREQLSALVLSNYVLCFVAVPSLVWQCFVFAIIFEILSSIMTVNLKTS